MKKKTLIVILFLSFILTTFILLENTEKLETYSPLGEDETLKENKILKEKILDLESVQKEYKELKQLLALTNLEKDKLNEILTNTYTYTAMLTGVEIDGHNLNLKLTTVNFNICRKCPSGYEIIVVEGETTRTITNEVPIYLLNHENKFSKVEWESLLNLERNPVFLLFESDSEVLFIREEDHPLRLEGKEIQEKIIKKWRDT